MRASNGAIEQDGKGGFNIEFGAIEQKTTRYLVDRWTMEKVLNYQREQEPSEAFAMVTEEDMWGKQ